MRNPGGRRPGGQARGTGRVETTGSLGWDRSNEDVHATRFEAESIHPSEHGSLSDDHVRHFDTDSESLYNLGGIVNVADQSHDPR